MSRRPWRLILAIGTVGAWSCLLEPGTCWAASSGAEAPLVGNWTATRCEVRPLSLRVVKLGGFLGRHVEANNRRSLPAGLDSPIPAGIEARGQGQAPPEVCRRLATDSDFFKWLEGACYAIAYDPSLSELAGQVERYANMLVKLQEADGYLGTRISPGGPFDHDVAHDLYVAGHLIEAAVAHFNATGSRSLLDAAVRLADFYIRARHDGHAYFEIVGTREHPEIELALVRLYRATGEQRFLDFSKAIAGESKVGPTIADLHAGGGARHAVRACYLLAGVAEHYMETGDTGAYRHLPGLWDEIVSTRMYLTGGIGYNESIPPTPFDLPQYLPDNPNRDIAETCASVAMMLFSWRMHAITGDSRYFDVIERILHNHYLGAISEDHLGNFYYNPLRRVGDMTGRTDHGASPVERLRLPKIHSTACCLPNSWRFFAQLPEYVFSHRGDAVLVNLYTDATARHRLADGTAVVIEMETQYPQRGDVRLRVRADRPVALKLALRIPAWCEGATVRVGGGEAQRVVCGRYHMIERSWQGGDEVVLSMPMEPLVIASRPEVVANRGQVAFQRGPLVYCLEKHDAGELDLAKAVVLLDPREPRRSVRAEYDEKLGLHVLKARVGQQAGPGAGRDLYYAMPGCQLADVREVALVPFYFRANRDADPRWITFIPVQWWPSSD